MSLERRQEQAATAAGGEDKKAAVLTGSFQQPSHTAKSNGVLLEQSNQSAIRVFLSVKLGNF